MFYDRVQCGRDHAIVLNEPGPPRLCGYAGELVCAEPSAFRVEAARWSATAVSMNSCEA